MAGVTGGQPGRPPLYRECQEEGCDNPHHARGLCHSHYRALLRAEKRGELAAGIQGTGVPPSQQRTLARLARRHEGGRRLLALAADMQHAHNAHSVAWASEALAIHELLLTDPL